MSENLIQEALEEFYAAASRMDIDAWMDVFAEEAVTHDPVGGKATEGKANIRIFYDSILNSFTEFRLVDDKIFISGMGAAVKWTGEGLGKSGKRVMFEGISIFEFTDEGKIQTMLAYWDPVEMLTRLL